MSKAADNRAPSCGSSLKKSPRGRWALLEGGVSILLAASDGRGLKLARAFLLHVTHVAKLIFLRQSC